MVRSSEVDTVSSLEFFRKHRSSESIPKYLSEIGIVVSYVLFVYPFAISFLSVGYVLSLSDASHLDVEP